VELAKRVAKKLGAVVAPVIRPGISFHHMAFPGTISVSVSTFMGLIKDYCKCLSEHGFKRIILLNGHGGNSSCLEVAVAELHEELPEVEISSFDWWVFVPREMGRVMGMEEGIHAHRLETSCMLALTPELVNMDKAVAEFPDYPEGMTPDKFGLFMSTVKSITDISKSGVVGDATKASKEFGEECLNRTVENMVQAFKEIEKIGR
jgi:creatinine amidohydrolase